MTNLQILINKMEESEKQNLTIIKKRNIVLEGENPYQLVDSETADFLIEYNNFELIIKK